MAGNGRDAASIYPGLRNWKNLFHYRTMERKTMVPGGPREPLPLTGVLMPPDAVHPKPRGITDQH